MSKLKKIENHVKKYANIIANVIEAEVEIVDNELVRIAGTGLFQDKNNEIVSGVVYKEVIKTKKSLLIKEPKKHELCKKCDYKKECKEKLELSSPILYKEEVIGVIGLICTTDLQKNKVLNNLDSYLNFLEQIGDFISGKVYEYQSEIKTQEINDILKQILNNMDKCVLSLDANNYIINANKSAMKTLKLGAEYASKQVNIISKKLTILGKDIFEITIDDKYFNMVGISIPISSINEKVYNIFIFDNVNTEIPKNLKISNDSYALDAIIGESEIMQNLKNKIRKIADTKSTVLITGKSGTGKELVARAIHDSGERRNRPFIAINCGAIPDSLLESELFGYVKGAFSGASSEGRVGKFELANTGDIFLDEIGEMPYSLQVKLLRVLQERTLVRIGSNKLINLDLRVIAATNMDLKKMVEENKFREDLYYRLNVIPIEIPPLCERGEDLFLIIDKLIEKYNNIYNKYVHTIYEDVKEILKSYSWPGNVRELENIIEFMVNMADDSGRITKNMLYDNILKNKQNIKNDRNISFNDSNDVYTIEEMEKILIKKALELYKDDSNCKNKAASKLGIGIATLYRKIDKYKLNEI
ncbi:sigma-54 interaction domain-containing protein [Fusobacterium varium]